MDIQKAERHMTQNIRSLDEQEMSQVSGGIGPILAALYGIAGNTAARTLGKALISRGFSIYGVYSAAKTYGGGRRRRRNTLSAH